MQKIIQDCYRSEVYVHLTGLPEPPPTPAVDCKGFKCEIYAFSF